jgi:hypothetical protein
MEGWPFRQKESCITVGKRPFLLSNKDWMMREG